jgi:TolB-like protein/Flp pilus assembly protein TadD
MKGHVSTATINDLRRGVLAADELRAAFEHLAVCGDCAALARESVGLSLAAKELRGAAVFDDEEHPDLESELFAFADGTLTGERRNAVQEHITHCRICREDVADALRTRRLMRRRSAPRRQWWLAMAAAAAIAIFGTLIWTRANRINPVHSIGSPIRSVAVLPLQNIGKGDDFLTVALADALTTQLHDVPALQVRPMSAVLASQNAAGLAVDSVIEGHFAVSGNLVEVTLSLTDSRTGQNVWAGTMSGPRDNLLNVVDNVSARTLVALNEKLGVQRTGHASTARSLNGAAFEEYLKARALNQSLIPEKHAEELAHLEKAVALDPQFAAAHADLSIALSLGHVRGLNDGNSGERAEREAREAVRLDPNLASGHLALGRALLSSNFQEALREFVASLRLNARDSQTMSIMTSYFVATGDRKEAECLMSHLPEIDPHSQEWLTRGYWYLHLLDAPSARRAAADALATKSHELSGCDIAAHAAILEGKLDEADRYAECARRVLKANYIPSDIDASIAAARGDRAAALRHLQAYAHEATNNRWAAMSQALIHAKLGDHDEAVFWTRRTGQLGSGSWFALRNHPWTQSLQGDREFQAALRGMRDDLDSVRPEMLDVYETICGPSLVQR